jgi:glutamine synthetase
VLRASIAAAGNDHRLGANEAPPAIISVFIGDYLTKLLDGLEKNIKGSMSPASKTELKLDIGRIPPVLLDNTDRNRTSPFAFTGNKFEFRAVGSSQNVAVPMSFLNAAVADAFADATTELKDLLKKKKRDEAVMELVRRIVKETKTIRFSGNGYSDEWKLEAKKRGLPILNTTPDALEVLQDKKLTQFLVDTKVLSREEIDSRYHIAVERYVKTLDIEHTAMLELTSTYVIPTMEKQMEQLGAAHEAMTSPALKKLHKTRVIEFEKVFGEVLLGYETFLGKVEKSRKGSDEHKRMWDIVKDLQPASFKFRDACDQAELLVSDELWPLPKYREMLLSHNLS